MSGSVLHILFDGPDDLASRLISEQTAQGHDVNVVDLSSSDISDSELVDNIFDSDKVISWHKRT